MRAGGPVRRLWRVLCAGFAGRDMVEHEVVTSVTRVAGAGWPSRLAGLHFREISGNFPGNVQEISGKFLDNFGKQAGLACRLDSRTFPSNLSVFQH